MQIEVVRPRPGAGVLIPQGRLTMVSAARIRDAVSGLVDEGRARIAVDLSGVEFMDSSGLGALIAGFKTARQAGGDLRIAAPSAQVKLVLHLTNMEQIFTEYPDAEHALAAE